MKIPSTAKKLMHHTGFKCAISFFFIIIFLIPVKTQAQNAKHELRINIYRSRVTDAAEFTNDFFNTTMLGFEYQYELFEYLNGIIGVRYIQIIAPLNNDIDNINEALRRFSKSFLTFDTGISLIPVTIADKFEVRFSLGASLRHRNAVQPIVAAETMRFPVVVINSYQNYWQIGGFFNLGFVYFFNNNWLVEFRGQFHTFKKGESVIDIGFSFGRKF